MDLRLKENILVLLACGHLRIVELLELDHGLKLGLALRLHVPFVVIALRVGRLGLGAERGSVEGRGGKSTGSSKGGRAEDRGCWGAAAAAKGAAEYRSSGGSVGGLCSGRSESVGAPQLTATAKGLKRTRCEGSKRRERCEDAPEPQFQAQFHSSLVI